MLHPREVYGGKGVRVSRQVQDPLRLGYVERVRRGRSDRTPRHDQRRDVETCGVDYCAGTAAELLEAAAE